MAKINIAVDHQLEREEAISKLRDFSDAMRSEASGQITELEEEWDENGNLHFSFRALGFKISGKMVTCAQQVTVEGTVPFAALPFRGAIESQVAERIREAIS